MFTDEVKTLADSFLVKASQLLEQDKVLYPVMFSITKGGTVTPISFRTNSTEEKNDASDLMKELAKSSDALVIIMDSYIMETKSIDDVPDSVKDYPGRAEALVCTVHTKGLTFVKSLVYATENGKYAFVTMDWKDMNTHGSRFENPYKLLEKEGHVFSDNT